MGINTTTHKRYTFKDGTFIIIHEDVTKGFRIEKGWAGYEMMNGNIDDLDVYITLLTQLREALKEQTDE